MKNKLMNLKSLLLQVGWSQSYFASRVDVSERTVSQWVNTGAPKLAILYLQQVSNLINPKE